MMEITQIQNICVLSEHDNVHATLQLVKFWLHFSSEIGNKYIPLILTKKLCPLDFRSFVFQCY